ncbi:helix-turn-helix transcriptional regulator [Aliikangiella coralliicola]|uniref:Helix-turn-helix transcriptional regulator n=1 Tax=Aliikangiella coralliicola TaxID=2592383 RepID=A0A545UGK1_9GAMM|nr:helix-turn-helix transcriptional regulator [Aliikangiella coralliicola]TQV88523.1 helix-turn-helix transcriptional regulator [Aliikangiella coralliicola]
MSLNNEKIKQLRHSRGWTQQHLAEICGVSLRTIQRVEKSGAASKETVSALASVFELGLQDLSIVPQVSETELQPVNLNNYNLKLFLAGLTGAVAGVLLTLFFQS